MPEYREGGYIGGKPVDVNIIANTSDYIIPIEFAKRWAEELLKKMNKELDSTEPDVLD